MKTKSITTTLLLTFVIGSIGFLLYQEYFSSSEQISHQEKTESEQMTQKIQNKIIAYYFHRTKRCPTCITIEEYSGEAVKNGFAEDIKTGRLEWKSVNIEDGGNEHFEDDYQLYTQSLVLVEMRDGKQERWKNLEKIWELVVNKEAFINYVQEKLKSYLEEKF